MSSTSCIAARSSSIPAPLTVETANTGASCANVPCVASASAAAGLGEHVLVDQIAFGEHGDRAPDVEEIQHREMLERLGANAFVRRDDQQQQLHAGGAGQHVVQKSLVTGDVDDPGLDAVVVSQVRET